MQSILAQFGFGEVVKMEPLRQGLINTTWRLVTGQETFILQKINSEVFREPAAIDANIRYIADYLRQNHPSYLFVAPLPSADGATIVHDKALGWFRMFPFVEGSHTKTTINTASEAYEAARQFGRFTANLRGFDHAQLATTIPAFHDLSLRYLQFKQALGSGNPARMAESADTIAALEKHADIVAEYDRIRRNPAFRLRVTHHDTKISNVLFDASNNGLCVIDLDTVMPGYFISDVGDMMRTYLCPVSEEEADLDRITVRPDVYQAIVDGYLSEMADTLTVTEKKYFFYAGTFLIYMQALRFLTDYLNNDTYYGATYPTQNLTRARNQVRLLECLYRL